MISVEELSKRFGELRDAINTGEIVEKAARDTQTLSVKRIFEDGQSTNGSSFSYDTKPGYFSGGPKASNRTGKTGNAIKTGYYPGGYAEFRAQQGRENSFVNWRLNNELQSDYANAQISPSSSALASPTPIKIDNFTYVITLNKQINIEKKKGLERKYGTIFTLNQRENAQFTRSTSFLLDELIDTILNA